MPIRCRTLQSFLEYWVFSATERLFPNKSALESDSRTGPDWIAPEKRAYRKVAQTGRSEKPRRRLGAWPAITSHCLRNLDGHWLGFGLTCRELHPAQGPQLVHGSKRIIS